MRKFPAQKISFVFLLASSVLMAGCATSLNKEGLQVKVTDGGSVQNCEFMKELSGSSQWGGASGGMGVDSSKAEVLNKAGKLGAPHLVGTTQYSFIGSSVGANAYKCPPHQASN